MRKFPLMISAAVAAVVQVSTANAATTFAWSISGGGTGSGFIVADPTGTPDEFSILSVSGDINGDAITSAPVLTYAGTGSVFFWKPGVPAHTDTSSPTPFYFLNFTGFAVSTHPTGDTAWAIYENTFGAYPDYDCGGELYCLLGPGANPGDGLDSGTALQVDFSLTPTPIPGALPLFASGLGALGLIAWRRKRKQVAAA